MGYDFSAPFVAARITLPDGDTFPLWTNVGGTETIPPSIPGQDDLQALCFVQEVQVKLDLSGLPQISVQLSPPFVDGMKFLDSPLADGRLSNTLEVQIGYASGTGDGGPILSPPYVNALVAPEVSIDTEIQINLKGQGLGDSARFQNGRAVGRDGETRQQLIERIAAGTTGGRRTLQADFSAIIANSTQDDLLGEPAGEFVQGSRSDWIALWELADITQCIMNISGPTETGDASRLMWLPRRAEPLSSGSPVRRYRLYNFPAGQTQSEAAGAGAVFGAVPGSSEGVTEMPLLSFACNTEAIWNAVVFQDILNHGARMDDVDAAEVTIAQYDSLLEFLEEPVDSGEGGQTRVGDEHLPEAALHLPGAPDNPEARSRVDAEVGSGAAMSVRCEIEVLGDPAIIPGDIVLLAGLGRRFDNRQYHVLEVMHSVGIGGFSTNLVIQSNVEPTRTEDTREPGGARADLDAAPAPGLSTTSDLDPESLEGI